MPEYIRNPLCQRPVSATSSMDWINEQAARIVQLEGKLEAAAGREHKANNRLQVAEGALEMIGHLLGLDADATPPEVLAAAIARLK